ncbi:hypothetical protein SGLAM104S_09042 [Streptomyces glaucescens]
MSQAYATLEQVRNGAYRYTAAGPFGEAVERARELARRGDTDGAWRTLSKAVPLWQPRDRTTWHRWGGWPTRCSVRCSPRSGAASCCPLPGEGMGGVTRRSGEIPRALEPGRFLGGPENGADAELTLWWRGHRTTRRMRPASVIPSTASRLGAVQGSGGPTTTGAVRR